MLLFMDFMFKYVIVYGSSVKIQPQTIGKDHVLNDEDVIQILKKYSIIFILKN